MPFNVTGTPVLPMFYCELHEILWLMKYSSNGWTAQMSQVFWGSTEQSISVFHAAQRSLKSPPPGIGTVFKPRGLFTTSQFVIFERLAISKPALLSACAGLGAADLSKEPLSSHFTYELCEYFHSWTCPQAIGNLSPSEISAAHPMDTVILPSWPPLGWESSSPWASRAQLTGVEAQNGPNMLSPL